MTDTLTPLTSAELAALKNECGLRPINYNFPWNIVPSLLATIEQQREQIEKLRSAVAPISNEADSYAEHFSDDHLIMVTLYKARKCREALAATEPQK